MTTTSAAPPTTLALLSGFEGEAATNEGDGDDVEGAVPAMKAFHDDDEYAKFFCVFVSISNVQSSFSRIGFSPTIRSSTKCLCPSSRNNDVRTCGVRLTPAAAVRVL